MRWRLVFDLEAVIDRIEIPHLSSLVRELRYAILYVRGTGGTAQ